MGLFTRKAKTEIEEMISAPEEVEAPKEEFTAPSENRVLAKVEKLGAQIEALGELRKINEERFSRLNEQIGEIRDNLFQKERDIKDIELKAVKAYDLVESVQPQQLGGMVQKEDAKIESLRAGVESNRALLDSVVEDLKDIRRKIEMFRGVEQVIKLSQDVKKDLISVEKVKADAERHADKVEGIFTEVEHRFKEFADLKNKIVDIESSFKSVLKEFDEMRTKVSGIISPEQLNKLKDEIHGENLSIMQNLNKLKGDLEQLNRPMVKTDDFRIAMSRVRDMAKKGKSDEDIAAFLSIFKLQPSIEAFIIHDCKNPESVLLKIVEFVRKERSIGRVDEEIKEAVLSKGWSREVADLAFVFA
jgi:hypothetical protein